MEDFARSCGRGRRAVFSGIDLLGERLTTTLKSYSVRADARQIPQKRLDVMVLRALLFDDFSKAYEGRRKLKAMAGSVEEYLRASILRSDRGD
jgi:hypothetical protein